MCVLADYQYYETNSAYEYSQDRLYQDDGDSLSLLSSQISSVTVSIPCRLSKLRLSEIAQSGCYLKEGVLNNAYRFVNALSLLEASPEADEISYTPYGNIVLDLMSRKGEISIEIGTHKLGFFTDFTDGQNEASEGIETDFNSVPELLRDVILRSF